jgi:hypothetical protein
MGVFVLELRQLHSDSVGGLLVLIWDGNTAPSGCIDLVVCQPRSQPVLDDGTNFVIERAIRRRGGGGYCASLFKRPIQHIHHELAIVSTLFRRCVALVYLATHVASQCIWRGEAFLTATDWTAENFVSFLLVVGWQRCLSKLRQVGVLSPLFTCPGFDFFGGLSGRLGTCIVLVIGLLDGILGTPSFGCRLPVLGAGGT